MKKLTTKIMDDGDEKEISVFLDDETAKVLETKTNSLSVEKPDVISLWKSQ